MPVPPFPKMAEKAKPNIINFFRWRLGDLLGHLKTGKPESR